MRRLLEARLGGGRGESGLTLVELLVASAMGIALLGGIGSMLISSMRSQPDVSKRAEAISTARWVMERLTREIRNGVAVDEAEGNQVSFRTYLRRSTCGGAAILAANSPAKECQVTYSCSTTICTRAETPPEVAPTGTPTTIVTGMNNSGDVFSFSPSETSPTFIGITLRFPNPSGPAGLTVSDGASLRNATLGG
jgi:Tfp pilus assembly protein PilW